MDNMEMFSGVDLRIK